MPNFAEEKQMDREELQPPLPIKKVHAHLLCSIHQTTPPHSSDVHKNLPVSTSIRRSETPINERDVRVFQNGNSPRNIEGCDTLLSDDNCDNLQLRLEVSLGAALFMSGAVHEIVSRTLVSAASSKTAKITASDIRGAILDIKEAISQPHNGRDEKPNGDLNLIRPEYANNVDLCLASSESIHRFASTAFQKEIKGSQELPSRLNSNGHHCHRNQTSLAKEYCFPTPNMDFRKNIKKALDGKPTKQVIHTNLPIREMNVSGIHSHDRLLKPTLIFNEDRGKSSEVRDREHVIFSKPTAHKPWHLCLRYERIAVFTCIKVFGLVVLWWFLPVLLESKTMGFN